MLHRPTCLLTHSCHPVWRTLWRASRGGRNLRHALAVMRAFKTNPTLWGWRIPTECDVPRHSALGKDLMERADFRDAYCAPPEPLGHTVVEIFFAIFARRPGWMNLMLIARNKAAALAGLQVPTRSEILNMEKRDRYFVGEKIGPWPIFFLGSDELVAGRDNKHVDFRLSIMKVHDGIRPGCSVYALHDSQQVRAILLVLHHSVPQIWLAQAHGERACLATFLACSL